MVDDALIERFRTEMTALGARFIVDTQCDRFRDPDLAEAFKTWCGRCKVGVIPKRSDVTPQIMRPFLKKVAIFERVAAPFGTYRYLARLTGQEFTRAYAEMSGKFIDEIISKKYLVRWAKLAEFVLAWGGPVRYLTVTEAFGRGNSVLEHFFAPLLDDAGEATQLLLVCNFERGREWEAVVADESISSDGVFRGSDASIHGEPLKTSTLNASDALHAHSCCKARLIEELKQDRVVASDYRDFGVRPDCVLVRFIKENEGNADYEPEISQLKTAHAAIHSVAVALAELRSTGQPIDFETQLAPLSNFGAASSSLQSAIWRLEKKLGTMST